MRPRGESTRDNEVLILSYFKINNRLTKKNVTEKNFTQYFRPGVRDSHPPNPRTLAEMDHGCNLQLNHHGRPIGHIDSSMEHLMATFT